MGVHRVESFTRLAAHEAGKSATEQADVGFDMSLNTTAKLDFSLSLSDSNNVTIDVDVDALAAKLGIAPGFVFDKHFPQKYRKQIENTNWKRLDEKLDDTIKKLILPELNTKLKNFVTPFQLNKALHPELHIFDGYALIAADVANPTQL